MPARAPGEHVERGIMAAGSREGLVRQKVGDGPVLHGDADGLEYGPFTELGRGGAERSAEGVFGDGAGSRA